MALTKQQVSVNFQKGLDTKSDPWQVPIGNFLELENSVFTKQGLLQKREGFAQISSISDNTVSTITTYKEELTALGNSLYAYNQPSQSFLNKGQFYSMGVETQTLVSNNSDLHQIDIVTSPNGLTCAVWWESINPTINEFYFSVSDSSTGQTLLNPTTITPLAGTVYGTAKVFYLNNNFVIIFPEENGGSQSLNYFSVNCSTLAISATSILANIYTPYPATPTIPNYFRPSLGVYGMSWDAVSVGNQIHVGYNRGANGFHVSIIKQDLTVSVTVQIDNTILCSAVGAMTDGNSSYFAYLNSVTGFGNIVGITGATNVPVALWAPQPFFDFSLEVDKYLWNITGSVVSGVITVIYERAYAYPYFINTIYNSLPNYSNQLYKRDCTTAGVVSAAPTSPFVLGAGLNSKSFVINNEIYFSTAYSFGNGVGGAGAVQTKQACYFLNDINGKVLTQLQYGNGAGYNTTGISNVAVTEFTCTTTNGSNVITNINNTANIQVGQRIICNNLPLAACYVVSIDSSNSITVSRVATATGSTKLTIPTVKLAYLYQAVAQSFGGGLVFGLRGAGVADIEFFKPEIKAVEAGEVLNVASGFLWNYDGLNVNENNFFLFPDSLFVKGVPNLYLTASTTSGSNIITVSGVNGLKVGQIVTGSGIPTGSKIIQIIPATFSVYLSNNAYATAVGVSIVVSGGLSVGTYLYQSTYEFVDNQSNSIKSSPSPDFSYEIFNTSVFTANVALSTTLTNCSTLNDLQIGQVISGAGIPTGTYITGLDGSDPSNLRVNIDQLPTIPGVAVAITTTPVTQTEIYFPTLRLSYKTSLTINIYRSGVDGVFEQIVPVREPIENDPTVNYLYFQDVFSDADIAGNNPLYTNGDILANIATPPCSDLAVFDGRLWLIDSEDGELVWYTKPLVQDEPVEFSDTSSIYLGGFQSPQGVTGRVQALTVMDDKLIIFKRNSIYYINGSGPDSTGANSQYSEPILITGTVGCISPSSVTYNPLGIVFQSDKGIWILGRDLSTNYFGAPVESLTQNAFVTSAQLIPATNQSRFSLSSGIMLMYDYFYGQWGTFTGIPNISTTIYEGKHTFLDQYGRICQQTPNTYLDISNPVQMKFLTNWFSLAGIQGYQRAYFMFLLGKYYSPHKLNVELAYDFDPGFTQSTLITPNNYASVYGSDPFYGSSEVFGGASQVEKWRIMLTKQKCDSVQMKVSEIFDASYGVQAGQGLTLSGMNFIIGVKKGYGPISQFNTAG